MGRVPGLGVLMQLKDLAVVGQGHLAGCRGGRREAQEDRLLVMVQFLVRTRSKVCLGSEGPRRSGGRTVEMRTKKSRVLVSHLCGC